MTSILFNLSQKILSNVQIATGISWCFNHHVLAGKRCWLENKLDAIKIDFISFNTFCTFHHDTNLDRLNPISSATSLQDFTNTHCLILHNVWYTHVYKYKYTQNILLIDHVHGNLLNEWKKSTMGEFKLWQLWHSLPAAMVCNISSPFDLIWIPRTKFVRAELVLHYYHNLPVDGDFLIERAVTGRP